MDYPSGFTSGFHTHGKPQLIYAISGVMHVETDHAVYVLPPSMALILPQDVEHAITMEGAVAMRQLFLHQVGAGAHLSQTRVLSVTPLLRELLLSICAEPTDWNLEGRMSHVAALILDEISRVATLPTQLLLPKDPRALTVARHILADPGGAETLEDLAQWGGASARTIERLFRTETGLSFGQWRLHARLNAGFVGLLTNRNIANVAAEVGFSSQSSFGVAFRRCFGLTPGQARKRIGL